MWIEEARVENLRGYTSCGFSLARAKTILVGQNNSGKTSILKLVNWLLNEAPLDLLNGQDSPSPDLFEFLLPARRTRNRARRLTLLIQVPDGRSHRRFRCNKGVAELRLNVRQTPSRSVYVALGAPSRGELAQSHDRAIELLDRLRKEHSFIYIPSFRDAKSPRFQSTLHGALRGQLQQRALHSAQGGAPSEYREIRKALRAVGKVAEDLASPLWDEMKGHLPAGLAEKATIRLRSDPADLVEWLSAQLELRLSTGSHDKDGVSVDNVGSGLQSLLDLAIHRASTDSDRECTLVVEEPESFLHPSAQRTLARALLTDESVEHSIITTHSPIVLDEAPYGDVVVCRDQMFFEPRDAKDEARSEINAALMTGSGAEMMFARSVLLVEGDGDRQFFEQLRRRLAAHDETGRTDELFCVWVGGKHSFAPWIRLLQSYVQRGEQPIYWLVVADGDAPSQVRQAFLHAEVPVAAPVLSEIGRVGAEMHNGIDAWASAVAKLNNVARSSEVPMALAPVDIEYAALCEASRDTLEAFADRFGAPGRSKNELLKFLGSKGATQPTAGRKDAWMRAHIGANLPGSEIPNDIRTVLLRWLEPAMKKAAAQRLVRALESE